MSAIYEAFWSKHAFIQGGRKKVKLEFFSSDVGYADDDRDSINNLRVGETWFSPDYGDFHTVRRIS